MSITGLPVLILVICGAVGLPIAALVTWRRGRFRVARTALALIVSQLLTASAVGLAINRDQQLFGSWSDLLGLDRTNVHSSKVHAGSLDGRVAAASSSQNHGVVLSLDVHGDSSGLTLPVKVYLPPQYSQPAYQNRRFPVIEVFDGFPGTPDTWLKNMNFAEVMDAEIAAGRMAPTIGILPTQNISSWQDSECVNAVRGVQMATYLTTDLRNALSQQLRLATDRSGWGAVGASTGGFCAVNLAMQPPYGFAAAASISGYFTPTVDRTTGDLYKGDQKAWQQNNPTWMVEHQQLPGLALYLTAAAPETHAAKWAADFAKLAHGPVQMTLALSPTGGHNFSTWRAIEPAALDWLSGRLAPPLAAATEIGKPVPSGTPQPQQPARKQAQKPREAEGANRDFYGR